MKKLKYLFVVFVAFLAMPFMVFADDTEATPTPTPAVKLTFIYSVEKVVRTVKKC